VNRPRAGETELFEEARRATTWHYQLIILREFLPAVIGAGLAADLLDHGPRHYQLRDGPASIPFEFADAAYRYGHAQVRQRYQVNRRFGPYPVFPDLMGFGPVSRDRAVDWSLHVDVPGHEPAQRAKRIDGRLPSALIALPTQISGAAPGDDYASLTGLRPSPTRRVAQRPSLAAGERPLVDDVRARGGVVCRLRSRIAQDGRLAVPVLRRVVR
jgi:hypothetical protein